MLLPLIALIAARMFTQRPRLARRAAWATGLIVAMATAFVPLVWVIALIAAVLAAAGLPPVPARHGAQPGDRRWR